MIPWYTLIFSAFRGSLLRFLIAQSARHATSCYTHVLARCNYLVKPPNMTCLGWLFVIKCVLCNIMLYKKKFTKKYMRIPMHTDTCFAVSSDFTCRQVNTLSGTLQMWYGHKLLVFNWYSLRGGFSITSRVSNMSRGFWNGERQRKWCVHKCEHHN